MIRVLIVEDQRMAREDMENYIQSSGRYSLEAPSQMQLWQKLCADRAGVNLS
mgnify:CR=1 FL=1